MGKKPISNVVKSVAAREVIDHLLSARFMIIMLLVICLIPLAVYVGLEDYKNRLRDYDRLVSEREDLRAGEVGQKVQGVDSPWTPENELAVLRAIRRPHPLSAYVRGLDGAFSEYWDFTPAGIEEGPTALRPKRLSDLLGQLDIEFLIRIVLGLLAVLLAFDAVSGEKEMGTLRLVFSQPISRAAYLAGKLVSGAAILLIPLAAAFLVAVLSSNIFGMESLSGGGSLKLLLVFAASSLYLLSFYALGLLVSSLTRSQKNSIIVLLVAWVTLTLAASPVASFTARAASPAPSRHVVENQKRMLDYTMRLETEKAMGAAYRDATGIENRMSYQDFLDNKEAILARIDPIVSSYVSRRRQLLAQIQQEADRRENRQNQIARAIMWLSPATTYSNAVTDLSGTGDECRLAWIEAAERYYRRLEAALFDDPPMITVRLGGMSSTLERRGPPSVSELPAFVPPKDQAATAIQNALPSIIVLMAHVVLYVLGGFVAFSRYDVR